MLLDLDELTADADAAFEADLCIVGSGAAGITLAREFLGARERVLLLESGGGGAEEATTRLYDSDVAAAGKHHTSIHDGRTRVLGGTTTIWGGQALPLMPIDFEARAWVDASGWPFGPEELRPFWERAGRALQLDDVAFDEDLHGTFGIARPGFDPALANHIYSRWSPQPNFAAAYRPTLAAAESVQVILHANVTQIVPSTDGTHIDAVEFASLSGRRGRARAGRYVVCCGGIETARLLLASDRVQPTGVGNAHDVVGRYFQDHLSVRFAELHAPDQRCLENLFHSFYRRRTKYYPLLTAGHEFQRRNRTLNISASVLFESTAEGGVERSKRVLRALKNRQPHLVSPTDYLALAGNLGTVARQAYRYLVTRRSYTRPDARLYLGSTIEQEPNPASRVTLDRDRRDALGLPRARLDWRLTPLPGHTLRAFAKRLQAEFQRTGLGEARLAPWVEAEDDSWMEQVHDVAHHIGTARMHPDPRRGVVNADCRVHGLDNLYLAGSAVFPTGGHSNPTFTLLLLTLRLADRLKALPR